MPFTVHTKVTVDHLHDYFDCIFSSRTQTHSAIEAFAGHKLDAKSIQKCVRHASNALNLEKNAHDSMVKHMAWGTKRVYLTIVSSSLRSEIHIPDRGNTIIEQFDEMQSPPLISLRVAKKSSLQMVSAVIESHSLIR